MKGNIFRKRWLTVILYAVVFLGSARGVLAGVPSTVFENVLSYNNHVYAITISDLYSWQDAETLAMAHGGHLVTVNDSAENQFLIDNYGVYASPWIGLNDLGAQGTWVWAYGLSDYTNWNPGEPSGGDEQCVVTNWIAPGKWNDMVCNWGRQAIVEWKSVPGAVNLPQTGQTECYSSAGDHISCAGTGQDGDVKSGVPWPEPRFTVSGDCVTDNLSGLIWAKNASLSAATYWQPALDYIAAINSGAGLCGNTDWRLPNANELQSLTYPAGDTDMVTWLTAQGFTDVDASYWSSTTATDLFNSINYAWYINMSASIQISWWYKYNNFRLLPVRGVTSGPAKVYATGQTTSYDAHSEDDGALRQGVSWPDPRFTASSDCNIDNLTGLIWSKNGNLANAQNWQRALDYIASLNAGDGLCGRRDWRLPNLHEMKSLINRGAADASVWLNAQGFSNAQSNIYWTSSNYQAKAWELNMESGTSTFAAKNTPAYVWPVSGRICYENLAQRSDTGLNYPSIQDAYDAASGDHTLKTRASAYCEDINFNGVADIILAGGYDQGFGSPTGDTVIYGSVTISGGGSVRAENIIIL